MFDEKFEPVKAVLIKERKGDIEEIMIDISSKNSQVTQYLGGTGTFIGQWPEKDIVIMKCRESLFEPALNMNKLAEPFHEEIVSGPILLIRMDENAEPKDLNLVEVLESKLVLQGQPQRSATR